MSNKSALFGLTLAQLTDVAAQNALPRFAAKQMADWLYAKNVASIDEMTNLAKNSRAKLAENYEVGRHEPLEVATSADGTKKYLFAASKGFIETAYIPDEDRHTLCVSSQVGCKMNCQFCMTGKQGFQANLTANEILNQLASIEEREQMTNMVFMGMGEPLDNIDEVMRAIEILTAPWGYGWSPRRITLSTIGVTSQLKRVLDSTDVHIAVSMHNANPLEREEMMPAQKAFPIAKTVEILRGYDWTGQRRLTFEYTMFSGWNDTPRHVDEITRLLAGMNCRVNLIHFNSFPNSTLKGSSQQAMERFRDLLNRRGFVATIRRSRGQDIQAACGLLSTQKQIDNSNQHP